MLQTTAHVTAFQALRDFPAPVTHEPVGWIADGRTLPEWHQCHHSINEDRCSSCHARAIVGPRNPANAVWSQGRTIREYPDPEQAPMPMWQDPRFAAHHAQHASTGMCHLDKLELDYLISTSEHVDDPDVNDESTENTTVVVRTTTIDEDLRKQGFQPRNMDIAFMGDDGRSSADLADRHLSITPYERPTPLTIRRIEWERRTKLSSNIIRMSIRETEQGQAHVAVIGITLNHEQRLAVAKRYLNRLAHSDSGIPSLTQIRAWHQRCQALPNLAMQAPAAAPTWLAGHYDEMDDDPQRGAFHTADTPTREDDSGERGEEARHRAKHGKMIEQELDLSDPSLYGRQVTATSEWELGEELEDYSQDHCPGWAQEDLDPLAGLRD